MVRLLLRNKTIRVGASNLEGNGDAQKHLLPGGIQKSGTESLLALGQKPAL